MKIVFAHVTVPTPFRSSDLGLTVTLQPGPNQIDNDALAIELVRRGVATIEADTHPNASSEDGNAEPQFAREGQALRADLESAKRTVPATQADAQNQAAAIRAEADVTETEEVKRNKDGVAVPKISPAPAVGTEALTNAKVAEALAATGEKASIVPKDEKPAAEKKAAEKKTAADDSSKVARKK